MQSKIEPNLCPYVYVILLHFTFLILSSFPFSLSERGDNNLTLQQLLLPHRFLLIGLIKTCAFASSRLLKRSESNGILLDGGGEKTRTCLVGEFGKRAETRHQAG